jgi:hypothetical protein
MIDFPSPPVLDQVFTSGSSTFKYDGVAWVSISSEPPTSTTAFQMDDNGDAIIKFGTDIVVRIKPTGLVLLKDDIELFSVSV